MYAIFEAKGKQFRAEPEGTVRIPLLDAEPGEEVTFDQVLLGERDGRVAVGQPALDGAKVVAEVVRHGRGEKIVVYKMKRRKGYRRKQGHRQGFTEIVIQNIDLGSGIGARPKKKAKSEEPKAERAKAEKAKAGQAEPTEKVEPTTVDAAAIEITDAARELAEEHGIDLSTIEGSGKEGRILKSDIESAIKEQEGK